MWRREQRRAAFPLFLIPFCTVSIRGLSVWAGDKTNTLKALKLLPGYYSSSVNHPELQGNVSAHSMLAFHHNSRITATSQSPGHIQFASLLWKKSLGTSLLNLHYQQPQGKPWLFTGNTANGKKLVITNILGWVWEAHRDLAELITNCSSDC